MADRILLRARRRRIFEVCRQPKIFNGDGELPDAPDRQLQVKLDAL